MKFIFSALGTALVVLSVMLVNLYNTVDDVAAVHQPASQPEYHIQLVTQSSNEHFWTTFKKGALAAGEELSIYVEFVDIAQRDAAAAAEKVEKAIYAGVDAIALQAADLNTTSQVLQQAQQAGLAVLTFENDIFFIPNIATVGSNSYDIGFTAGTMGAAARGGRATVAVLIDDSGEEDENRYKNLKLQGLLDAFSAYEDIKIEDIYTLNAGRFEVERLTGKILEQTPQVDLIICTDERNTPGVAQTLVDANRVGDIAVIGYGAMPQTLNYIERGVIYGTITPAAFDIGYYTVAQLRLLLEGRQISDNLNTDIYTVTSQNLAEYKAMAEAG